MDTTRRSLDAGTARLGLWDATSIIVGIIIGVGIFELPANIFRGVPGPWHAMGVWVIGGLLVLAGAFCFAELASAYPRSGGEYVYLTRAYGSLAGYLFAWAQLTVIRPGSIGALAYIFAMYAGALVDFQQFSSQGIVFLAILSVLALTFINILGVTLGAAAQNLLTIAKILGLLGIIVVGFCWGTPDRVATEPRSLATGWFAVAMINILWAYSGWHEAAYVAAEVKDGRRNIPLALVMGTLAVTIIYLLVNVAYLWGAGMQVAEGQILAADVIALAWPGAGRQVIALLIVISALGAINGMIFTTARMFAEFGVEHRVFRPLTHWSRTWGTPVRALFVQGAISIAMILGVVVFNLISRAQTGSAGDSVAPAEIATFGKQARDGLEALIAVTAAVFWGFFFLTGLSLLILRCKDPDVPRPFRVPLYPMLPLIFCAWCAYMVYGAIEYKRVESLIGLGLLIIGLPFYFMPQQRRPAAAVPEPEPVGSGAEM